MYGNMLSFICIMWSNHRNWSLWWKIWRVWQRIWETLFHMKSLSICARVCTNKSPFSQENNEHLQALKRRCHNYEYLKGMPHAQSFLHVSNPCHSKRPLNFPLFSLGPKAVEAHSQKFEVKNTQGNLLFSADDNEVVVGAERLRVLGKQYLTIFVSLNIYIFIPSQVFWVSDLLHGSCGKSPWWLQEQLVRFFIIIIIHGFWNFICS